MVILELTEPASSVINVVKQHDLTSPLRHTGVTVFGVVILGKLERLCRCPDYI